MGAPDLECACPSTDAYRCAGYRYGDGDTDEECECACHVEELDDDWDDADYEADRPIRDVPTGELL